jgi:hypothetical protein
MTTDVVVDKEEIVEDKDDKKEVTYTEDEQRAIDLGWKPKDQWQGGETEWVPAKWWLKYGDVEQRAQTFESQDKQKTRVIEAMKGHYLRVKEDAKKEVLETIKRQKREAIKDEDFQKVAELDVQADLINNNLETKFRENDTHIQRDTQVDPGPDPEFFNWNRQNSWYKLGSTDSLTVEADSLAVGYKQKNPNASYKQVLEYVSDRIPKIFPEKFKKDEEVIMTAVDDGTTSRQSPRKTEGKYKLNDAEKEAAKMFGMTEEEYSKDLKKWDAQRGRG